MQNARLSLALAAQEVQLPGEGRILCLRARAEDDLSALPKERLDIVQSFQPDHAALTARGFHLLDAPAPTPYAAAIVFLPRSKPEAQLLIAQAVAATNGGLVLVDGQKTDGVDSLLKATRKLAGGPVSAFSKAHGKLFWFTGGGAFDDWAETRVASPEGFRTVPGVFSADRIDRGSALLAEALPAKLAGHVVDLGAGWGYLSRAILAREAVERLDLVEAERLALDCARANVADPRARFHWADATSFTPDSPCDVVVMNPPFHAGRAGDPALGQAFIDTAARILKPGGSLWMVANRHLPYEGRLATLFRDVTEAGGDSGFKIFYAQGPVRRRSAQRRGA
ncbi:Ribosomal RNA small subunit methyltransferase C [Pseudoruegeria aquimaris]|uniref:Ribosomal RNA small subunit methyltransferase C n=1 Tax=Pseudoruegeria aquimaris TaxID=393663 RepID=A0A1Y5SLL9_9RHOB|nr:class I SAM-dependent methyltransferase [Pseudoruegeria aquimaris]SLN40511.1 Ribosomal RNA small subunit methyltransferase C [Pseudoruegeria aquimaris]